MWETVIGLEVHARLDTRTKAFCGCSTAFGAPPNTQVCAICLAYPGSLPVLNQRAVELAIRLALAAGSVVHTESVFARKNYFYPDLPKGYQISQYQSPLATGGSVEIGAGEESKRIPLLRIHMEEDAGKLLHLGTHSAVDLNRAGAPLVEVVTEPEIASSSEAIATLGRIRQLAMFTGACDGNMEEGSLRCDANVSVRRKGQPLGTRTEVKNLNSFRFLGRAIEFEIARQIEALERGETIRQETRLYDVVAGETRPMRSKEEAHDYRYFPEPDLLPLRIERRWIEEIRASLPELPLVRRDRYHRDFGLPFTDAEVLVSTRELADYFEAVVAVCGQPKTAANWVRNEVLRVVNEQKIELGAFMVSSEALGELITMIEEGTINGKTAKEVFDQMAVSGGKPAAIVEAGGLSQISDPAVIAAAAATILARHAAQVEQYRGGKVGIFGFLVGQLMKETRGKARPELANSILRELLDRS
jgi:aspartyl-tRNA(Asn)/glutamyl-tRNA(Gln) amidotransferase subunit B